jgi:ribosomal protein L11 methyltransferase
VSDRSPTTGSTPTNWLLVQIDIGDNKPEPLEQALLNLGAVSVEYSDAGNDPILEPAPETTPLWKNIRMAALLSPDTSEFTVRLAVAGASSSEQSPEILLSIVENEDWVSKWKQTLKPTCFGEKLWICPPDTPCPENGAVSMTMEPGLAFGTGAHPTTALCLDWLATQRLRGETILDFGCGSGILGIAGLVLGANCATAVDIDVQALTATLENARRNQCETRLRVRGSGLPDSDETFDVIVANILSGTLIEFEPSLRKHARPGTKIALSGILTSQVTDVFDAYRPWVDFDPPTEQQEWAILTGCAIRGG